MYLLRIMGTHEPDVALYSAVARSIVHGPVTSSTSPDVVFVSRIHRSMYIQKPWLGTEARKAFGTQLMAV